MKTKATLVNLYTCDPNQHGVFQPISVEVARMVAPAGPPPERVRMDSYEFFVNLERCTQAMADTLRGMDRLNSLIEHLRNRETAQRVTDLINREIWAARAAAQRA